MKIPKISLWQPWCIFYACSVKNNTIIFYDTVVFTLFCLSLNFLYSVFEINIYYIGNFDILKLIICLNLYFSPFPALQLLCGFESSGKNFKTSEVKTSPCSADELCSSSLRGTDEVFQALEDNQVSLSTMKASHFVRAFEQEVDRWERQLSVVLEVTEMVLTVQRQWIYLEVTLRMMQGNRACWKG